MDNVMLLDLKPIERAAIAKLLDGDHPILEALRKQVPYARVKDRQYSSVALNLFFEVDSIFALPGRPGGVIGDVFADVSGSQYGLTFLLFIRHGTLSMLEGVSPTELPKDLSEFSFKYLVKGKLSEARDSDNLDEILKRS